MKTYDLVDLASRNLRESKLRNSLTTIGISVGVASLVAMLALGIGLQSMAGARLAKSGLFDSVFVTSRQDFRDMDDRNEQQQQQAPPQPLTDSVRRQLEKLPGVVEVYPQIRIMGELRYDGKTHFVSISGLPPSAKENEAFETLKGNYFSGPEAEETILHIDFVKDLRTDAQSLIGKEVVVRYAERREGGREGSDGLSAEGPAGTHEKPENDDYSFSVVRRDQKLKVVGVIEAEPYGGMRRISGAGVFMPNALAERLNVMQASDLRGVMRAEPGERTYLQLVARVDNPGKVQGVQQAVDKMGFRTFSINDATKGMRRFFAVLDVFLGIFGSLALAVASLAIVNTLVMAVLERRREIGIMKALGASDGDVKKLFFAEAGVMGVIGGAVGVLLGWLMGKGINLGLNIYLRRQDLPPESIWTMPVWLVAAAVGFAVVVSLVAGLYPAARAARLDPVRALRYE
jgi:putative ABC transport system permease protein